MISAAEAARKCVRALNVCVLAVSDECVRALCAQCVDRLGFTGLYCCSWKHSQPLCQHCVNSVLTMCH